MAQIETLNWEAWRTSTTKVTLVFGPVSSAIACSLPLRDVMQVERIYM